MQNADPRLNVSQQQQQTTATGSQPLNNVGLTPCLNTQNNGLSQVSVGIGSSVNSGSLQLPPVVGGQLVGGRAAGNAGTNCVGQGVPGANVQAGGVNVNGPPGWLQNELANLQSQQTTLQDQVRQSEQNLAAQHAALMAQQQGRVEDAVRQAQETSLQNNACETNTDLASFDTVLQPIIESCTKDSISAGKAWILQNSVTASSNQVIAEHLLKK